MTQILQDILKLSVPERIIMVEAIWDSIAEKDDQVGLSPDAKQLLEERLDYHNKNRDEGSSWTEVKARIKGQL
jgi:putative addiction module component (TIGR02574 family)